MEKKKHWFNKIPKIYQEIVLEEFKKQRPNDTIYNYNSLSEAFSWPGTGGDNFFYALYCSIENLDNPWNVI